MIGNHKHADPHTPNTKEPQATNQNFLFFVFFFDDLCACLRVCAAVVWADTDFHRCACL